MFQTGVNKNSHVYDIFPQLPLAVSVEKYILKFSHAKRATDQCARQGRLERQIAPDLRDHGR
jgi:hypothetical protein